MENHHIILQPLNILHRYFKYLSQKNELKDFLRLSWVFAKEIANGKITATLLKAKRLQIPVLHGMTDFQVRE